MQSVKPFFVCESAFVSLFKYKERIVELSRLSEEEVVRPFYLLLRHVTVSKEELIDRTARKEALRLCHGVDGGRWGSGYDTADCSGVGGSGCGAVSFGGRVPCSAAVPVTP